jgi:hypothetical protein
MHRMTHGQYAADTRPDQAGGDRSKAGGLAQGGAAAGLRHHQRDAVLRQQVAQAIGRYQVGLGLPRALVGLLEAEGADLGLGQEGAVAVAVDQMVGFAGGLAVAEHLLHAG